MVDYKTADLCDQLGAAVRVCQAPLRDFGARRSFSGRIATLRCLRDNGLVRTTLEQPGEGRVLVIDGGGVLDCALVGGILGQLAVRNGWAAIVVNGAVRDLEELAPLPLGVRALGTFPQRGTKLGTGESGLTVSFGGIAFEPGHWLCADHDGLITLQQAPAARSAS
jgi:regulator of ribonuclease activity A